MHKSKINNVTCDCIGIKSLVQPNAKVVLTDNGQNLVVEQNGIISVYQLIDNETSIQGKLLWEHQSKKPIFAIVPLD